jgi:hypothetical protein
MAIVRWAATPRKDKKAADPARSGRPRRRRAFVTADEWRPGSGAPFSVPP